MVDTYPLLPSQLDRTSTRQPVAINAIIARYNNGYAMRQKNGINAVVDGLAIVHTNLNGTDRDAFWTFYDAKGRWGKFLFTLPGDSTAKLWTFADVPSESYPSGDSFDINVKLEQVFDLDT